MARPFAHLRPLHLAALMVWLGIGADLLGGTPGPRAGLDGATVYVASLALHLGFLAAVFSPAGPASATRVRQLAPASVALVLVFALVALRPYTSAAVLLIVVMACYAPLLTVWRGVALWAGVNLALFALYALASEHSFPLVNTLMMASFQLFAMLTSWATRSAEQARDALVRANAELAATRTLLAESARDQERLALSRELHDVAGHKLTALKLNLAAATRRPEAAALPELALSARLADELLADIRALVAAVRADGGVNLAAAIGELAAPLPEPRVHVAVAPDATVDTVEQAEAVLRSAQEAITNAARHSGAANVWIVLRRDGDRLELDVRDDGRGGGPLVFGSGLNGMRERLRKLGGDLDVGRGIGGGVALKAWLRLA